MGKYDLDILKNVERVFYGTYGLVHDHANLIHSSIELLEVDLSTVLDVEVFEVFGQELCLINVLIVLLFNILSKLCVESKYGQ